MIFLWENVYEGIYGVKDGLFPDNYWSVET
jgi:hypothetical protein